MRPRPATARDPSARVFVWHRTRTAEPVQVRPGRNRPAVPIRDPDTNIEPMTHHNDEPEAWSVLESETLIERWWMRLRVDRVELPSGEIIPEFHVVEYPHWVLVIAQDDDGRLLFVDQYRHGIGQTSLEFPAGMLEPNEDPMAAAGRELLEETGYRASGLREVGTWAADPSRQSDRVFAYAAESVQREGRPELDATEDLVVRRLTVDETEQAVAEGRMMHGLHVAALYRALHLGLIRTDSSST